VLSLLGSISGARSTDDRSDELQPSQSCGPSTQQLRMQSLVQSAAETYAVDEFNNVAGERIGQKDPYGLPIPQGLSKRDADILRRCRRRAHQLDHNAVLCYCCPCFFGLNTAICISCGEWVDGRSYSYSGASLG
jgi:hypothetical protein